MSLVGDEIATDLAVLGAQVEVLIDDVARRLESVIEVAIAWPIVTAIEAFEVSEGIEVQ